MLLEVSVLTPKKIIFKGRAKSVIVPGEQGTFEVQLYHKRILSRLVSGWLSIDEHSIPIKRGMIKASQNSITIIVEQR